MHEWSESLRTRLRGLRLDPAREAEIIEELSEHLDQHYQEFRNAGLDHAAAVAAAEQELLDADTLAAYMRPLRQANVPARLTPGTPRHRVFSDLGQDLRLAVRMLRKQAGLTTAVVLTLALGVGATGAIFALVDKVLLRDLPFPEPAGLVTLTERTDVSPTAGVSPLNLRDWQRRNQSFDELAGYIPSVGAMVMRGEDGPENVSRQWVTEGVFRALGVAPVVGRTFIPEDDRPQSRVAVLAETYWRNRFEADPNIVGQSVQLDGQAFTIVGVIPQEAQVIGRSDLWALISIQDAPDNARAAYFLTAIGRLKSDVSLDAAQSELSGIAASLAREYPATNEGRAVALRPLRETVLGTDLRRTSLLFLGVVGFVLAMCFANIANLLLTRTAARSQELSIRAALGADRGRLLRQFWTENFVLSLLGGIAGLAIAGVLLRVAPSLLPTSLLPPGIALVFDARIILFCGVAASVAGMLLSLLSMSQVVDLASASRNDTAGSRSVTDRSSRTRELLVVGQVATAVALLYCAGLLSRTLLELQNVDPGYRADSVLTAYVDPHSRIYPTRESLVQFFDDVDTEVENLPTVANAAWATVLPFGDSLMGDRFIEIAGQPAPTPTQRPISSFAVVSGNYFRTLEMPLLAGRTFEIQDSLTAVPVCIVNEAFARLHLSGREPLGERVSRWLTDAADGQPSVCEVVGVAGNLRGAPDETSPMPQLYVPVTQLPVGDIFLIARPELGDAEALAPSVRAAVGRIDREQMVGVRNIRTLSMIGDEATAAYRFRATLVVVFGALALVLAMIGLFGVLAYSVQRRWREFGVRKALGASARDMMTLIARGALRIIAPGILVGGLAALVIGPLLGAMLFGVRPTDPVTLIIVLVVLTLTAAAAVALPAWRAAQMDPAGALRSE
ncbi:MAG: ABC transporter permease [Gammaproteobacteria bacterium]